MHRLAGLSFILAVLATATFGAPASPAAAADPGPPAPDALVANDGQVVPLGDVLPDARPEAMAAAESVFGADGRTQVSTPSAWPNSAIGQISYSRGGFTERCTGVLIDRNTVLTAGSCVKAGGSGPDTGWSNDLTFAPGLQGVVAPYGVCGQRQLLTTSAWANSADENQNWGLVQLNCSAGNAAGWMGLRAESVDSNLLDQPITVRGYPGDRPFGTMWTMDDQVRAVTTDLLYTQADLEREQLGAPAYQASGCSGPCALAVIGQGAHGSTAPHSTNNHGVRITAARANDIAAAAAANNGAVASNDDFAASTPLSGQEGTVAFDTTGASRQIGEPRHATQAGLASLWYRWTAPTTGYVTFDPAGTPFATVLAAYTGSSLTSLTERGSNHITLDLFAEDLGFPVTADTTYRIAIDGQDAAAGAGTLSWHMDTVTEPDTTGPTITIGSPVNGAVHERGSAVLADFTCSDPSGVTACTGFVADGARINTTTLGRRTFTVDATDARGNTSRLTARYTVVRHRVDAHVRRGTERRFVGDDVVNTNGQGQSRSTGVARSTAATFYVRLQNDGTTIDGVTVRGQGSSRNFTVRYFAGDADVTARVQEGTYRVSGMDPGATAPLRVVLRAKATSPRNATVTSTITVSSVGRPAATDVVKVTATRV
jgi:glutamyl endopeptidase